VVVVGVALMESVRSLDASGLLMNRDQFLDLASSLRDFFAQNGLLKAELDDDPSSGDHLHQMVPQMSIAQQANFHHQQQQLSPQLYQNYPGSGSDDQTSPGMCDNWLS